ncbi:hypothetical protein F441_19398 [Phytophthora nicotianae CJ01A1]|uniref:Uncharacterized protein n=2 Tax=Phytophthora nicotianae TaxID=4792 RepID=W2I0C0_PHYNI|nr:hypothetical protein L915_18994 [Phytophthora nicotianae]ETL27566.1 hypothetical protein L916_18891 [Phytophthora nicotianae]ETP03663.1 hypothetical protein F441_19398 [Phytophthora nicotianae CJ01A1]
MELLSLVAKVDPKAFHMLMTEQCGHTLDDEESEEEEEEFRVMLPGDDDGDIIFSDYDESEEEEEEEENEEDRPIEIVVDAAGQENPDQGDDEVDEGVDDVLVLPPDTLKSERRQEREKYLSPRFDFISLTGVPGLWILMSLPHRSGNNSFWLTIRNTNLVRSTKRRKRAS